MATKDVGGREMRTGEKGGGEWNKNKGRQMIVEEENDTESDMGRGGEKERRKKAAGQEKEKDIRREPAPGCGGRGRGGGEENRQLPLLQIPHLILSHSIEIILVVIVDVFRESFCMKS